jgi:hypothetical protein
MAAKKKADRLAPAVPAMPRLFEAQAREFIKRHVEGQRTATATKQAIERDLISAWSGRVVTDIGKADVIDTRRDTGCRPLPPATAPEPSADVGGSSSAASPKSTRRRHQEAAGKSRQRVLSDDSCAI